MEKAVSQNNGFLDRTTVLLILIILLGALLRLHGLASRSLWYDEGCTIAQSKQIDPSFRFFSLDTISDPPVIAVMVRVLESVLSFFPALQPTSVTYDFLLRLIPCVFSIIALPAIFLVCRILTANDKASLLATLLGAVSPFQIYYAQELKAYSIYLAVSLAALYCFLKTLEEDQPRYWIGLVLAEALSMYVHLFSVWNIALFNLFFVLTLPWHTRKLVKWAVAQAIVALLILPAVLLAYQWSIVYESIQANSWALRPDAKSALITFKTFFAGYGANSRVYWPIFVLSAVLFLGGLFALRRRKSALLLVLVLTVLPIVANVIIWRVRDFPFYEHRIFIFSGAVCYCVAALGIVSIPWRALRAGAALLLIALILAALPDYYSQSLHPFQTHRMGVRHKVANRDAAAFIESQWREGDFIGHASHFTLFPFYHYLPDAPQSGLRLTEAERRGFLMALPNEPLWERYHAIPVRAELATKDARRIWLVESWWEPFEPPGFVKHLRDWHDGHFVHVLSKGFDGITVSLYVNDPALLLHAECNQISDSGSSAVTAYRFDPTERAAPISGLSSNLIDGAAAAIDGTVRVSHLAPTSFSARLHLAIADAYGVTIAGQRLSCAFDDIDRDGLAETLSFPSANVQLRVGGAARIGEQHFSLIAMDPHSQRALLAALPLQGTPAEPLQCILASLLPDQRPIECQVYASAKTVTPAEFTSSDPSTDTWTLASQYRGPSCPPEPGIPAMVANLTSSTPQGKAIYKDLVLSTGRYAVFVWAMRTADAPNKSSATARFSTRSLSALQEERPIGEVQPNDPSATWGWAWLPAGSLQSDGQPFRLTVSAYNNDLLARASFSMGPVIFIEDNKGGLSPQTNSHQTTIGLDPHSMQQVTFPLPTMQGNNTYLTVEFWDSAANESRTLSCRIPSS
jgi:hypothetical protein